jgi:hypothetical protein
MKKAVTKKLLHATAQGLAAAFLSAAIALLTDGA